MNKQYVVVFQITNIGFKFDIVVKAKDFDDALSKGYSFIEELKENFEFAEVYESKGVEK